MDSENHGFRLEFWLSVGCLEMLRMALKFQTQGIHGRERLGTVALAMHHRQ